MDISGKTMFAPVEGDGVGIDLTLISRFQDKIDDHRFLNRIYTVKEIADIPSGKKKAEYLASRWALKEAVSKALGCGIGAELSWLDIETVKDDHGKPHICLSEHAYKKHGSPEFMVSLSHEKNYAIAVAIVKRKQIYGSGE